MDSIESIKVLKENIREEIEQEMMKISDRFKEYVRVEHANNPKYTMGEYFITRINYGIKTHIFPNIQPIFDDIEGDNYYCYLPNIVKFLCGHELWNTNLIFYNNKSNSWFIYNCDPFKEKFSLSKLDALDLDCVDKFVEFSSLDTDTQIVFLEQLKKLLD